MKNLVIAIGIGIGTTIAMAAPVSSEPLSKDIAARIEAIPVQTLTISDEQFLKGDAYGKPTTIAGVLRVAQGSGQLPLVIFAAGSGDLPQISMSGTDSSNRWAYPLSLWIRLLAEGSSARSSISRNWGA